MATAQPAQHVHLEIPGAQAMSEFQGYNDDCGPNAELMALHVCPWDASPLTANGLDSFRWQYVQAGKWGGGTTLANILWHLQSRHAHIRPGAIPYSGTPNYAAIHAYIKQETLLGNPVIIQVLNAAALSHNESGVHSHFVTLAGIDSTAGYLTLNGDTTDALGGSHLIIPAYWNTWAQLQAAQVCGAIALDRGVSSGPPPAPAPAPTPAPTPSPTQSSDVQAALAAVTAALAALQQAVSALAAAVAKG